MKVKELIYYLSLIENKEQEVFVVDYDFSRKSEIQDALEIKSASDQNTYPIGVCLTTEL